MGNNGGFTLIELILVTVIIAILAGMVTLNLQGRREEAQIRASKGDISIYGTAIDLYELDTGRLPKSLNELVGGKRDYVKEIKKDPWQNEYVYEITGKRYQVYSRGPDGQKGTGDDVTSTSEMLVE